MGIGVLEASGLIHASTRLQRTSSLQHPARKWVVRQCEEYLAPQPPTQATNSKIDGQAAKSCGIPRCTRQFSQFEREGSVESRSAGLFLRVGALKTPCVPLSSSSRRWTAPCYRHCRPTVRGRGNLVDMVGLKNTRCWCSRGQLEDSTSRHTGSCWWKKPQPPGRAADIC